LCLGGCAVDVVVSLPVPVRRRPVTIRQRRHINPTVSVCACTHASEWYHGSNGPLVGGGRPKSAASVNLSHVGMYMVV